MTQPEESTPSSPRASAGRRYLDRLGAFLVSPRLAIALLVVVLASCVAGVTFLRGPRAGQLIFGALWFNGLLALLAISSGAAFFTRIWRRKLTLVSVGMIVFHLSFMAMLGAIIVGSLFFFRGSLRLTEGETLPNGRLDSYDEVAYGRFFDSARLKGETTLVKTHVNYVVDGENKKVAYEVAIEDGESRVHGIIYATQKLVFDGVRYFRSKEGYSVLVVMLDRNGTEVAGWHVPLQSYRMPDDGFRYATGTSTEELPLGFPPDAPRIALMLAYRPSTVAPRTGDVTFRVRPVEAAAGVGADPSGHLPPPGHGAGSGSAEGVAERTGEVPVGGEFDAGDYKLSPREIRYWVAMEVRYDPGLVAILTSLCFGLGGMVLTFVGRIRQGAARKRAA